MNIVYQEKQNPFGLNICEPVNYIRLKTLKSDRYGRPGIIGFYNEESFMTMKTYAVHLIDRMQAILPPALALALISKAEDSFLEQSERNCSCLFIFNHAKLVELRKCFHRRWFDDIYGTPTSITSNPLSVISQRIEGTEQEILFIWELIAEHVLQESRSEVVINLKHE